jgi:hypothetical protein
MELTLPSLLLSVGLMVGGYIVRYLQAKNNPNAPIIPVVPAPVEPEPKLGEGLILKLLLDLLKQLSQQQVQQQVMQAPPPPAPEPVDVNELMRLLSKTLQTQPPQSGG